MADTTSPLDDVYAKWEAKNPFLAKGGFSRNSGSGGGSGGKTLEGTLNSGRQIWRNKLNNAGPPPQRRSRFKGRNNAFMSVLKESTPAVGHFKASPTVLPRIGRQRPVMGRCCTCMPESRSDLYSDSVKTASLQNLFDVDTRHPNNNVFVRTFDHLVFACRRTLNYKYPEVSLSVLTSPRVVEAIQKGVQDTLPNETDCTSKKYQKAQREQRKKAKSMIKRLKAELSNRLIRLTGWFLHKFLALLLSSIVIHKGQLDMVRKISERNLPVLFLPTHRSHLDYILVTFILFNYDIRPPHVAAGDNLMIPVFGFLLRGLGAYFIRRKLDVSGQKDYLYRAILHSYMEALLRERVSFEIFIEGGRTRSGKALHPKGGLLSVAMESYTSGVIPDAYIVPVGISYDRLVEGHFNNEQMGQKKVKESFINAMKGIWKTLRSDFGICRVDFAQPFSLKEYVKASQGFSPPQRTILETCSPGSSSPTSDQMMMSQSDSSLYNGEVVSSDDSRRVVQGLAEHVVYTCVQSQAVMSTHLLAFLMLTVYREGVTLSELTKAFEWLKEEVNSRGRDIGFSGPNSEAVAHGIRLLEHLFEKKTVSVLESESESKNTESTEERLSPIMKLPTVFELTYYSNVMHSVFILESALANAVYSLVDPERWMTQGHDLSIIISKETLFRRTMELCDLLKYEYIFKPPCLTMDEALLDVLDKFTASEILQREEESSVQYSVEERRFAQRLSASLGCEQDDDSEDDDFQVAENTFVVNQSSEYAMQKLDFLRCILSPTLETYYIAVCHLTILQEQDLAEDDFCKTVHAALKKRVMDGVACYAESASLESLKNAIRGLLHLRIMDSYHVGGVKMVGLHYRYKVEENLQEYIEQMERFRAHLAV